MLMDFIRIILVGRVTMKFNIEDDKLLSFFEVIPEQQDGPEIPTYYKKSTFIFNTEKDYIQFSITPSIGEVKIKVSDIESERCYCELTLLELDEFTILKDTSEEKIIEVIDSNEDKETITKYIFSFRPNFSMKVVQSFNR